MWILGIETSTRTGGLALFHNDKIISEFILNVDTTHSSRLMLSLDTMLNFSGITIKNVKGIAVSIGPGSFTGLRIGISTAMGLAKALKIPIIGLPTLEVLAHNLCFADGYICPILTARSNEVYTAIYKSKKSKKNDSKINKNSEINLLEEIIPGSTVKIEDIGALLHKNCTKKSKIFFIGELTDDFCKLVLNQIKDQAIFAPVYLNSIHPGILASLGAVKLQKEDYVTSENIVPLYCRRSEFEYKQFRNII